MRSSLRWFVFLLLPLLFSRAHAQARIDCNALKSRVLAQTVHYCVMLPPSYDANTEHARRYPVLYFLHGLGENEQTLFQTGGWDLIQDLRQKGKISDFLVVAPEGKASFYINSANGRVRYSDFFINEFIPYIESHYSVRRERSARAITGVSMGGYGALRFAFAYPQLFSSVSAESAALFPDNPHEINAAMNSGAMLGRLLGAVFGNPINMDHWNQNSPFVLAKRNRAGVSKLAIYFNCGDQDEFGFEKGAEALHKQLQSEGIHHEFHIYSGNHSAAYFLSHLDEILEFHSHAFANTK